MERTTLTPGKVTRSAQSRGMLAESCVAQQFYNPYAVTNVMADDVCKKHTQRLQWL